MDVTPLTPKKSLQINRYGNGGFVINDEAYRGNILINAGAVVPWLAASLTEAPEVSFMPLLAGRTPEILLIGAGANYQPLPAELREYFRKHKVAADCMDTGAACRTYNVLLTEGRQVAAALIAV